MENECTKKDSKIGELKNCQDTLTQQHENKSTILKENLQEQITQLNKVNSYKLNMKLIGIKKNFQRIFAGI